MARCKRCSAGEPCVFKHGIGGRTNHGCTCDICRAAMRKVNTEWARKNRATPEGRERHRANARRSYENNRDERVAQMRQYRQENLVRVRQRERDYRSSRIDHARAMARSYYWSNPERHAEWDRQYRERNGAEIRRRQRERYYNNWDQVRARDNARPRHSTGRRYPELERQRRERLAAIPAPRAFEAWIPAEDALVTREDLALVELCYMLGRSYNAVANRRNYLRKEQAA